jgi:hypothetical protein
MPDSSPGGIDLFIPPRALAGRSAAETPSEAELHTHDSNACALGMQLWVMARIFIVGSRDRQGRSSEYATG